MIHAGKRVFIGGRLYIVRSFNAETNAAHVESIDGFVTQVDASTFDDDAPSYRNAVREIALEVLSAMPVEVKYCLTCKAPCDARAETCDACREVESRLVDYLRRGGRHAEQTLRAALALVCGPAAPRPFDKKGLVI